MDPMVKYIAFVRAINVGGRALVRMSALRDAFVAADCSDVQTVIQSGNVVFEAPAGSQERLRKRIEAQVGELLGSKAMVIVRTAMEMDQLVSARPFAPFAGKADVKLYVAFLASEPKKRPKLPLLIEKDGVELVSRRGLDVLSVSRPLADGRYGVPNAHVESEFGVEATSRNWNTVVKVCDVARATVPRAGQIS